MIYFYALTYDEEFSPGMVFYVGQTIDKQQRLSGHKRTYGKNCVLHEIDTVDCNEIMAAAREQYHINYFRELNGKDSLYNKNNPSKYAVWAPP